MLSTGWQLAQSSGSDQGFSVPILMVAAAVGLAWLAGAGLLALARRVPDVKPGPTTYELPRESPALASMLCDDFELGTEEVPATVLDLAARRVLTLEEVQPGKTICRVREPAAAELTEYEQRVLHAIASKAIDGVVPAEALTTGPEAVSKRWRQHFDDEVIAEAHARGLTYDRWPARFVAILGFGTAVVIGLLYLASAVGGDTDGEQVVPAVAAGAVAILSLLAISGLAARWRQSRAQLPTPEGRAAAARCLGFQQHVHENEHFDTVPPAAVVMWGRHLAYAAALGAARTCIDQLPMGTEDDRHAWSTFGGRWRKVRVRYPRAIPPGWGKHPAFALFLAVVWGGVAAALLYGLLTLANAELTPDPTFTREQLDWIGRGALIACIPFLIVVGWALWVLVRAVPDLWRRHEITGDVVRRRQRRQIFGSDRDNPKYWYYVALDGGTGSRVSAFRVRPQLYRSCRQSTTVTAEVTPNLGYVRSIVPTS